MGAVVGPYMNIGTKDWNWMGIVACLLEIQGLVGDEEDFIW